MSRIEKDKCDNCEKTWDDWHAEIGWIHFDITGGCLNITMAKGRKEDGHVDAIFHKANKDLDFCSLACFNEWVKREE